MNRQVRRFGFALLILTCSAKPASSQTQEWVARYNGPADGHDHINNKGLLAVDMAGNIYVAGESPGSGTSDDFATVKYTANGTPAWASRYHGGFSYDTPNGLAIDSVVNIYVTGTSYNGNNGDVLTIKYDSGGSAQWIARYNSGTERENGEGVAVDNSGNVYVGGQKTPSGGNGSMLLLKYNSTGIQQWVRTYAGPGGSDTAYVAALDAAGNIYFGGSSDGSGTSSDYAALKYDAAGSQWWVARYNNSPANSSDNFEDMTVDSAGNAYITGYSYGGSTNYDIATVKFSTNGTQVWVARYEHGGNGGDIGHNVEVDAAGNVYVTGGLETGNTGFITLKYNASGTRLWASQYAASSGQAFGLAVDGDGNAYVTGKYTTVKYNASGSQQWVVQYAADGDANNLVLDSDRSIILAGYSYGGATGNDFTVVKYSQCFPPSVTGQPSGQTLCSGGSAMFSVAASGTAPLGYQWRKGGMSLSNDGRISGATTASLTINPVNSADTGNYDVVISNACGSATSNLALLTVSEPPVITMHPADQTIADCSPAVFTVVVSGGGLTYQWRKDGGNLSDGGHVRGSSTATLTISPVSMADEGSYDVVVTNLCGNATSNPAGLTLDFGERTDCNGNGVPDDCDGGVQREWVGSDGEAFTSASNWSPAGVPGSLDHAVLSNGSSLDNGCVLASGGGVTVCRLTVESGGGGEQVLQINEDATFFSAAGTTVAPGGEVRLEGGELAGGMVENLGNTITGFGRISADVDNHGVIRGESGENLVLTGVMANQADGQLVGPIGSLLDLRSAVTQEGQITAHINASVVARSMLTNSAGGLITLWGGALGTSHLSNAAGADIYGFGTIDGSVLNEGQIVAIADLQIVGDLTNDGTVTIQSGILTITGNLSGSGSIVGGFGGRGGSPAGIDDSGPAPQD